MAQSQKGWEGRMEWITRVSALPERAALGGKGKGMKQAHPQERITANPLTSALQEQPTPTFVWDDLLANLLAN